MGYVNGTFFYHLSDSVNSFKSDNTLNVTVDGTYQVTTQELITFHSCFHLQKVEQ